MYRYYSTQRPVGLGTFPDRPVNIENFDSREQVEGIGPAWGYLEYQEPLTADKVKNYELVPASSTGTDDDDKEARRAYEEFRLRWMIDHGYSLTDLICELDKFREESDPDMSLGSIFSDWEFGYGFGSEIWPCFEEFLDCEYRGGKQ